MNKSPRYEQFHLAEEMALYEPSPAVLKKIGEAVLYAIVAPYGSGKDSIIQWLTSHYPEQFSMVVGDTTRQRRPEEKPGVQHHFRTKPAMVDDLHHGRFVQVVPGFDGNFYATRPEQYADDKINLKPIQARAMANFYRLGFKKVEWLQIVPHSAEAWEEWISARVYSPEDKAERDQEALQSYVMALSPRSAVQFVLNDDIEKAARRILRLAEGRQMPDATLAKQAAGHNLQHLKKRLTNERS